MNITVTRGNLCSPKSYSLNILTFLIAVLILQGFVSASSGPALTLLHSGETYGVIRANSKHCDSKDNICGGMSRRAAAVKKERHNAKEILLLDTGNFLGPDHLAVYRKGTDIVNLYNALGYDAVALGKHDFGIGVHSLAERVREANFTVLSANMDFDDTTIPVLPWTIINRGGMNVGIFGLTGEDVKRDINPVYLEGVSWADPFVRAEEAIEHLKQMNVDLIICLSNMGVSKDVELAARVGDINLIMSGNTSEINGSFNTVSTLEMANGTMITAVPRYGTSIGRVSIEAQKEKSSNLNAYADKIPLNGEADPVVAGLVDAVYKSWKTSNSDKLGKLESIDLEYFLGRTLDMMRRAGKTEVAFINSGAIHFDMDTSELTVADVERMIPYVNRLVTVSLSPDELNQLSSISSGNKNKARLHFRGFQNGRINGRVPRAEEKIKCTTIEFLANGGDGYSILAEKNSSFVSEKEMKELLVDDLRDDGVIEGQKPIKINSNRVILNNLSITGNYKYTDFNDEAALYTGQTVPGLSGAASKYLSAELHFSHDRLNARRNWENHLNLRYDKLDGTESIDRAKFISLWAPASGHGFAHSLQVDTVLTKGPDATKVRPIWVSLWSGYSFKLSSEIFARAGIMFQSMKTDNLSSSSAGVGGEVWYTQKRLGGTFTTEMAAYQSLDKERVLKIETRQKAEWDINDTYALTFIGEDFYYRTKAIGKLARKRQIFGGITVKLRSRSWLK